MNRRPQTDLLIATKNGGKVRELSELLAGVPLRLRDLSEFPAVPTAEESGATFEENAEIKARFYAAHTGLLTLADDSGLEVEALGGAPGVLSARYAGDSATDEDRVALLLREMSGAQAISGEQALTRRARFVCAVALFEPRDGACEIFLGTCEGRIGHEPRGTNGFGYDPVFLPRGFDQTFAQLPGEVKQRISHRAKALGAARAYLAEAFPAHP